MKTGKKVNTGILKNVFTNIPVSIDSHIRCFSLIYIEFPAQQLAGRFSVRLSHSQGVR